MMGECNVIISLIIPKIERPGRFLDAYLINASLVKVKKVITHEDVYNIWPPN